MTLGPVPLSDSASVSLCHEVRQNICTFPEDDISGQTKQNKKMKEVNVDSRCPENQNKVQSISPNINVSIIELHATNLNLGFGKTLQYKFRFWATGEQTKVRVETVITY